MVEQRLEIESPECSGQMLDLCESASVRALIPWQAFRFRRRQEPHRRHSDVSRRHSWKKILEQAMTDIDKWKSAMMLNTQPRAGPQFRLRQQNHRFQIQLLRIRLMNA